MPKMKAARSGAARTKARSKSEVYTDIASSSGLSRKQVASVFDGLASVMKKDLGRGPGVFTVPGLMKVSVIRKPATKARTAPNPFRPGEMMEIKAKPARKVVKVRPLRALKDMV
jgi:nucleoid DNA-binding protein